MSVTRDDGMSEGEIPAGHQVPGGDRFFPCPERLDLSGGEGAPEKAGCVDPAVEMGGGDRGAFPGAPPVRRHQEIAGVCPDCRPSDGFRNRSRRVVEGPVGEQLLVEARPRPRRGSQVAATEYQREGLRPAPMPILSTVPLARTEPESQAAVPVDDEGIAGLLRVAPFRQQALDPLLRRRRINPRRAG